MYIPLAAAVAAFVLAASPSSAAPQEPGSRITVLPQDLPPPGASDTVVNRPKTIPRPDGALPRVPPGFVANLFADRLDHARWLAVAPGGDVFLAEPKAGKITVLRDADGDGAAEERSLFAGGFARPHGIAFANGAVYIADTEAVWRIPYQSGDMAARGEPLQVTPDGALGDPAGHWTRNLAMSGDGRTMYVSIGSRANLAPEDPPRATVQEFRLNEDGTRALEQRTLAGGLRNPVGIQLRPDGRGGLTDEVWVVVNERDGMGDDLVPDYLAHVQDGEFYGWPYAYIGANPQPGLESPDPDLIRSAVVPETLFEAHTAALGLAFYDGDSFPDEMRGDAFVGLHGSWNAFEPRGYAVARVDFVNGRPSQGYELFATGFWADGEDTAQVWGRPVGVAVGRDGSLLVADDVGQVVWRIQAE